MKLAALLHSHIPTAIARGRLIARDSTAVAAWVLLLLMLLLMLMLMLMLLLGAWVSSACPRRSNRAAPAPGLRS